MSAEINEIRDQPCRREIAKKLGRVAGTVLCLNLVGMFAERQAAAGSSPICGTAGDTLSYAGATANELANGLSASITETDNAAVEDGHVAGWIGIYDPNANIQSGRPDIDNGEWLQVGIEKTAGLATQLYYEVNVPALAVPEVGMLGAVAVGRPYRLKIEELNDRSKLWEVSVNGKRAGPLFNLPDSQRLNDFSAQVMSENDGGQSLACNYYRFKFSDIRAKGPGYERWHIPQESTLATGKFGLVQFKNSSFTATSKIRPSS